MTQFRKLPYLRVLRLVMKLITRQANCAGDMLVFCI